MTPNDCTKRQDPAARALLEVYAYLVELGRQAQTQEQQTQARQRPQAPAGANGGGHE
ncbi:MAG: hypothetical protein KDE29_22190 [Anaerolineales bacterium]|nr:hypothetical protein [Anaerolineales bacterium]